MGRLQRLSTAVILASIWLLADGMLALASDEDSIQRALSAGQQAMLERHYRQAVHVFENGLKDHPENNRLRLELGRAYLSSGADSRAIRLFREILGTEPGNRPAKLELARALGYGGQYEGSNVIYRQLLSANAADEAAAIGLASNLLHQQRSAEAMDVVDKALTLHSNSLRLQEYKDRIESGQLGGEEREVVIGRNLFETDVDYVNDSAGNHSWLTSQRVNFGIGPGLTNHLLFVQQFQHGLDDPFEMVETFNEELRWRFRESLLFSAGGGAVRFNKGDVHPIYETSVAFKARERLVLGAGFSRIPITPDAEATEHRLTAQGWEAFASWTPARWQIGAQASRQHYSDGNIGNRQSAEVIREWGAPRLIFEMGYRYRHASFAEELAQGYFSPNDYQSHLAMAGVLFRLGKRYRGALIGRFGAESVAAGSPFSAAGEIHVRNEVFLGNWTLELDYSKYHLVQSSGAYGADAGRFAFTYHF
jgi:tetratricopeptide (TPR) repeat protein